MADEARDGKTEQLTECEVCFYGGHSQGEVPSPYRDDTF